MLMEMLLIVSLRNGDVMGAVSRYDFEIRQCEQTHTEQYCRWRYNFNNWPNYPMYKTFEEYLKGSN